MINIDHLYKIVGSKLQQTREEKKLTQQQFADQVGVTRTSISNIETGKQRSPLSLLYLICKNLQIELKNILPSIEELNDIENHDIKFQTILNPDSLENPHLLDIIKKTQKELKQNNKIIRKGKMI